VQQVNFKAFELRRWSHQMKEKGSSHAFDVEVLAEIVGVEGFCFK
jgi:hypothetical protein